jgi:hypothetical protein
LNSGACRIGFHAAVLWQFSQGIFSGPWGLAVRPRTASCAETAETTAQANSIHLTADTIPLTEVLAVHLAGCG